MGGERGGDRSNPLLKYKESEEIQCPDVILSEVNPFSFHARIVGNKLIGKVKQLCAGLGEPITYGAILRVHVGLESSKVVGGSRHVAVGG